MKQYEPCSLCWYQRIIMYPFTIILGIASFEKIIGSAFIP
ncbi:disulfide bond formation protein B [Peribacillus simplex]